MSGIRLRATGYAGLYYANEAPGLWRFWDDTTPGMDAAHVGEQYPTKELLIADMHLFAAARGYGRAS